MEYLKTISVLVAVLINVVLGTELTFELPDNERQCFFEKIDKGVKSTLEFQVITGGQYDVDMELTAPNGQILYKDVKKQYDSFTWTPDLGGIYKFCFSNEFSTFSHKVVYFDLEVGDEKPIVEDSNAHATAMTLMESSAYSIHESLKYISNEQNHFKLREATGRLYAESLNDRVSYWSVGQAVIILLIGVGQVAVLRSFFTDKKPSSMSVMS
ncbi:transmembrane emp24 domain-containing protein 7-like isoform X1 [Haliotis rufescens]|uniref:transmembrane emp24 domain-containing protein 7-like isoform X1 n=1 Tax=Haliotis rufescens TaxID=6454 RepID=UPI001EAFF50F|nr:transmembrane emp24 domain-containing protein 7-like isoform X1 [Haliotis rufescens]